ncbi:MAG: hypothetical protein HW416_24 [Chloroflexi bacterium]|nr:hypothetical protein [Chloroflexota bacterium]
MIRFLLDENISAQVAVIARSLGVDAISSHECGRDRLTDEMQLGLAGREGRCIVTYDRRDFRHLTNLFAAEGWPHAGAVLVPRSIRGDRESELAHAIASFAALHPDGLPPYGVDYLSRPR